MVKVFMTLRSLRCKLIFTLITVSTVCMSQAIDNNDRGGVFSNKKSKIVPWDNLLDLGISAHYQNYTGK